MSTPRARWSDPPTSHAAGKALSLKRLGEVHRAILDVVVGMRDGATWKEVSLILEPRGIDRQTISPRWRFLHKHGLLETRTRLEPAAVNGTPMMVAKTITRLGWGRQQEVHYATQEGLNVARLIRLNLDRGTTEVVEHVRP
jgi:hypothetical protein